MKQLLQTIYALFSSVSQARLATSLARSGKYREAQALYKK
jgi:hypothetical protein